MCRFSDVLPGVEIEGPPTQFEKKMISFAIGNFSD